MSKSVEELRAELRTAEDAEKAEREAAAAKVRPKYSWQLTPDPHGFAFDESIYPGATCYKLTGTLTNKAELDAVGTSWKYRGYGSSYIYVAEIERFVGNTGGGCFNQAMYSEELWAELSAFIASNGAGGNVTKIFRKYDS